MSERAQKIEAARRIYVATLGTPREKDARDALEQEIAAARDQAERERASAHNLLHVLAVTDGLLLAIDVPAPSTHSKPEEPLTLFDFVNAKEFTNTIAESNNVTLTTALHLRGLKMSPETIQELAHECARNAAQVVLATELTRRQVTK